MLKRSLWIVVALTGLSVLWGTLVFCFGPRTQEYLAATTPHVHALRFRGAFAHEPDTALWCVLVDEYCLETHEVGRVRWTYRSPTVGTTWTPAHLGCGDEIATNILPACGVPMCDGILRYCAEPTRVRDDCNDGRYIGFVRNVDDAGHSDSTATSAYVSDYVHPVEVLTYALRYVIGGPDFARMSRRGGGDSGSGRTGSDTP